MCHPLDVRGKAIVDELVALDIREIAHLRKLAADFFVFSDKDGELGDEGSARRVYTKYMAYFSRNAYSTLVSVRGSLMNACLSYFHDGDRLEKGVPGLYMKTLLEGPMRQINVEISDEFHEARGQLLGIWRYESHNGTIPLF